jgi:hypothetical protein
MKFALERAALEIFEKEERDINMKGVYSLKMFIRISVITVVCRTHPSILP